MMIVNRSNHTVVITISKWAISATLSSRLGAILLKFSFTKSHDGNMCTTYAGWNKETEHYWFQFQWYTGRKNT